MIKTTSASKTLVVFIEGDGRAWINTQTPSQNPTPQHPVGWEIASKIEGSNVLYLSRPCQYLDEVQRQNCTQEDWTQGRFSPKLVALMEDALTQIKHRYNYETIVLGGYSGGGTMASLLALRRSDVLELITVASPLDTQKWTQYHHISPLTTSLNPGLESTKLCHIKQRHYVGENDTVVPPQLTKAFVAQCPKDSPIVVSEIPGAHHGMEGFKIPF